MNKLREGLAHLESKGGTALRDAVVASADKLAAGAKNPKQVLILITDGDDNASTLEPGADHPPGAAALRAGDLFDRTALWRRCCPRSEAPRGAGRRWRCSRTRRAAKAFFPKNIEQVDRIAAEVARDIRNQYALGYHSTKPSTVPGFRHVVVTAKAKGMGKLTVRTRTGYYPYQPAAKKPVPFGTAY